MISYDCTLEIILYPECSEYIDGYIKIFINGRDICYDISFGCYESRNGEVEIYFGQHQSSYLTGKINKNGIFEGQWYLYEYHCSGTFNFIKWYA